MGHNRAEIIRVADNKSWDAFLACPTNVYQGDPHWVQPLRSAIRQQLAEDGEFKTYGDFQAFVAIQNGAPVGRIVGAVNQRLNEKESSQIGLFGYFECINDQELANELLSIAEQWLRERGCVELRGPIDLSTHINCLCLVDGFDSSPYIMMPYNPRYYPTLFEGAGLRKAKDALAYHFDVEKLHPLFERAYRRALHSGIRFRPVNVKGAAFESDCRELYRVFSNSFAENWSATSRTEEEFLATATDLKRIVEPDCFPIAEFNGDMVGFFMTIPDINIPLKHVNGRLNLPGIAKFLWYRRKINRARVLAVGVLPEFQKLKFALGPALVYKGMTGNRQSKNMYENAELSWVWEDNKRSRNLIESAGGIHYKTYRIYQKSMG